MTSAGSCEIQQTEDGADDDDDVDTDADADDDDTDDDVDDDETDGAAENGMTTASSASVEGDEVSSCSFRFGCCS
jgi:hypothetical protein